MLQKRKQRENHLKIFSILILTCFILFSCPVLNAASSEDIEEVRVGLYYNTTALETFQVKADDGVKVGYTGNDRFKVLIDDLSGDIVTVRKDACLKDDDSILEDYGFEASGQGSGYYHIQIGESLDDWEDAVRKIDTYAKKGIRAYSAYTGTWQVWTGFYTDKRDARSALKDVEDELGSKYEYCVIEPSQTRIAVLSGEYSKKSTSYTAYTVQSGDTLTKIGQKFDMTVSEIMDLNGLTSDFLRVGQVLQVKGYGLKDSEVVLLYDDEENPMRIRPEDQPYQLELNNQAYRGELEVKKPASGNMTVINVLSLEEYLYGVIPAEMGSSSAIPLEALKAQAIVSRTYILNSLGKHANSGFDLCPTEHCQVYKGMSAETSYTNKAVDSTEGEIITYNGEIAQVFFSSSNGGSTEEVKNVWNPNLDLPYLKSFEDEYDPADFWEITLTADQIKKKIGDQIGDIINVTISKTADSQRVIELLIQGEKDEIVYTNERCRTALGLYSQLYTISTDADSSDNKVSVMTKDGKKKIKVGSKRVTVIGKDGKKSRIKLPVKAQPATQGVPTVYTFSGKGRGHGIGMSQKGAMAMAEEGYSCDEILEYYFPGTEIED